MEEKSKALYRGTTRTPNAEGFFEPQEETDTNGKKVKAVFASASKAIALLHTLPRHDRSKNKGEQGEFLAYQTLSIKVGGQERLTCVIKENWDEVLKQYKSGYMAYLYTMSVADFTPNFAGGESKTANEWISEKPVKPIEAKPVGLEDIALQAQILYLDKGITFAQWQAFDENCKNEGTDSICKGLQKGVLHHYNEECKINPFNFRDTKEYKSLVKPLPLAMAMNNAYRR